ncbi:MAG: phospholipase D-like domain-containing protein [Spirochaetota bacterium]
MSDATDTANDRLPHLNQAPPSRARERLRGAVESIAVARFSRENRVEVLKNGDEIFPAMLEALRAAKRTIEFVTFVYWKGEIAREMAETLAERAGSGVHVRVLLDAYGSKPMEPKLIEIMTSAGVEVERFRPIVRWKLWQNDHRTHRKIAVIDEQVSFTGGVGIASEWEGDARGPDEWRDTHFRLDGPITLMLKATFLTDWRDTDHAIDFEDASVKNVDAAGDVDVALVDGSAQIGFDDAERVLEAMIAGAEQRILIQTPYFNPTEIVLDLMRDAIERGVEVDLLIPGPNIDKRVSVPMAEEMFAPLIEIGARVWIFQPTMMHVKALLVDGTAAMVGSINVNRRSMQKDEETALVILNERITSELEKHFKEDVARSNLSDAEPKNRSFVSKLVSKILKPVRGEF